RHAMIWFVLWFPNFCAQRIAVLIRCGFKIRDSNRKVVQTANHGSSPA
ncbi:MAG: hypothetical protein ACI9PU_000886, partial [Ascidiaceihabitans sp.]